MYLNTGISHPYFSGYFHINLSDNYIKLYTPEVLKLDFSEVQFMDSSGIGLIMGRFKLIKSLKIPTVPNIIIVLG